jgi:hypothetical protein
MFAEEGPDEAQACLPDGEIAAMLACSQKEC